MKCRTKLIAQSRRNDRLQMQPARSIRAPHRIDYSLWVRRGIGEISAVRKFRYHKL